MSLSEHKGSMHEVPTAVSLQPTLSSGEPELSHPSPSIHPTPTPGLDAPSFGCESWLRGMPSANCSLRHSTSFYRVLVWHILETRLAGMTGGLRGKSIVSHEMLSLHMAVSRGAKGRLSRLFHSRSHGSSPHL